MTTNPLPLIIEVDAIHDMLPTDKLLLVAVCQAQVFTTQHIPGSVLVQPSELVAGIKPATGKLPPVAKLNALFSRIGLTPDTHVVAYDDEGGGWAGRLIWTLDVIGHTNYSYLNGGLTAWLGENYATESGPDSPQSSNYRAEIDESQLVFKHNIESQLGTPNFAVWDARADDEYTGSKETAARNGHIPGAVNLDWLELMDRDNHLRLKPLSEIAQRLQAMGINAGKQVVTHCHTHHRSGLSYLVGKALNLNIKAYDGSWGEWGNDPNTPITTGPAA